MKKVVLIISSIIIVSVLAFFIFIPAFAGELSINPVISLGDFEIRWYGLIMAVAILASYFVARKNAWKFGISTHDVDDYSFWAVIVGILGARIYYVVFTYDYFLANPTEIYKIWHGGLAIYGAVLFGLAFTYLYARKKAYSFLHLFDLIALSLPLGQAIGRLGNFINQEAYGTVTDLPWKMYVEADGQFHHPAFLYESIYDLLVFFVLYKFLGKAKSGILGLSYLFLYSFGRFFIEGIRTDSFIWGQFRIDQVMAFILVVVSGFLILRIYLKQGKPH